MLFGGSSGPERRWEMSPPPPPPVHGCGCVVLNNPNAQRFVLLWVELSCKGRCSETFERGRECDCDSQCKKYGKCCSDYDDFCEGKHQSQWVLLGAARAVHPPLLH